MMDFPVALLECWILYAIHNLRKFKPSKIDSFVDYCLTSHLCVVYDTILTELSQINASRGGI